MPSVKCGRYSSNRFAENWSIEMTTRSLGGAGAWAADWVANNAAAAASNLKRIQISPSLLAQRAIQRVDCRVATLLAMTRLGQFRPQPFVDELRVGLALHGLHRLADEEADQLLLASLVLGDLVGG